ncbi:MAG: hypothetical protein R6U11_04830, partial [Bacteroidales bacterium]
RDIPVVEEEHDVEGYDKPINFKGEKFYSLEELMLFIAQTTDNWQQAKKFIGRGNLISSLKANGDKKNIKIVNRLTSGTKDEDFILMRMLLKYRPEMPFIIRGRIINLNNLSQFCAEYMSGTGNKTDNFIIDMILSEKIKIYLKEYKKRADDITEDIHIIENLVKISKYSNFSNKDKAHLIAQLLKKYKNKESENKENKIIRKYLTSKKLKNKHIKNILQLLGYQEKDVKESRPKINFIPMKKFFGVVYSLAIITGIIFSIYMLQGNKDIQYQYLGTNIIPAFWSGIKFEDHYEESVESVREDYIKTIHLNSKDEEYYNIRSGYYNLVNKKRTSFNEQKESIKNNEYNIFILFNVLVWSNFDMSIVEDSIQNFIVYLSIFVAAIILINIIKRIFIVPRKMQVFLNWMIALSIISSLLIIILDNGRNLMPADYFRMALLFVCFWFLRIASESKYDKEKVNTIKN